MRGITCNKFLYCKSVTFYTSTKRSVPPFTGFNSSTQYTVHFLQGQKPFLSKWTFCLAGGSKIFLSIRSPRRTAHNRDPTWLQFWGIDHVYPTWRGSKRVRDLSQRETKWIFLLNTLTPRGLKIELDLNCFISKY